MAFNLLCESLCEREHKEAGNHNLKRTCPQISPLLAAIALIVSPCILMDALWAQPPEESKGPPPALVETAPVMEQEVISRVTLLGNAEPWLETVVAAESDGLVKEMLVDEGDRVDAGQVLCRQDDTLLRSRIKAARAALEESRILLKQALRDRDRQRALFKKESVAEKAYDDAQAMAEAQAKRLARQEAELAEQEDLLAKKIIRAPVTGFIVKRQAQLGEWLDEGEAVVTLVVLDPIRLMIPVPERYIDSVHTGDEVVVRFDGVPGRTFTGTVSAVIPQGNDASRTFPVRIHIPGKDNVIKAGMLGRAVIPIGRPHKALLVPKDALVLNACGASVFVIRDGMASSINVQVGPLHESLVEVEANLKPGEPVVVRGNERLMPGQKVTIIPKKTKTETAPSNNGASTS